MLDEVRFENAEMSAECHQQLKVRFKNAEMSAKCYKQLKNCLSEALAVKVTKKYVSKLMYRLFYDTPAKIRWRYDATFEIKYVGALMPEILRISGKGMNPTIYLRNKSEANYLSLITLKYVGFSTITNTGLLYNSRNMTLLCSSRSVEVHTDAFIVKITSLLKDIPWSYDTIRNSFESLMSDIPFRTAKDEDVVNVSTAMGLYSRINFFLKCNQHRGILIEMAYQGQTIKMLDENII